MLAFISHNDISISISKSFISVYFLHMTKGYKFNTLDHRFNNATWEWVVFVKLNKTGCSLVNFGSCFIVHSLGMGLFLFVNGPSFSLWMDQLSKSVPTHPCTNEVEVTPRGITI